ncbi:MAG: hypothetical protein SFV17_21220 [Candidatus Obscuribacter sp.]|nr:hypothetical protein [Candidatus Obscuribacter sp.]
MNKRNLIDSSRLFLSLACGFACGQLLFNQTGQRPYAGPVGALASTGLTAALLTNRRRREKSSLSLLSTPAQSAGETAESSVLKPVSVKPVVNSAAPAAATTPVANPTNAAAKPGAKSKKPTCVPCEAKVSAKPFLEISFGMNGRNSYHTVSVWAHDFVPQDDWQASLYQQLLQVGQVDWTKPRRNGPTILQFTGKLKADLPEEEFRQTVVLPLLSIGLPHNGDRPVDSWLSFYK